MKDEEIIEALATKVMGWTSEQCVVEGCNDFHSWVDAKGEVQAGSRWDPITDANDSKQVRGKLSELGWNWDLGSYGYRPQLLTFSVSRPGRKHDASGETEGQAVALCALKTLSTLAQPAEAKCPTCQSPQPHLHPAVQYEGEVQPCNDAFHRRVTNQNPAQPAEGE